MFRTAQTALLILVVLAAVPASALQSRSLADLDLEVIQSELPQTTVHSILQSRDGYLWVSTYEGVVRTDGITYEVFDRQSTAGGLGANGVLEIYEDSRGALWFGTFLGGVSRYAAGTWSRWGLEEGLGGQFIRGVREAGDGTIWIGTNSGLFTIVADKVVPAKDPRLAGSVRRMATTTAGEILAGYEDGRLLRVTTKGAVEDLSRSLSGHGVFALATMPDGTIWAGTDGGGVFRIAGGVVSNFGTAQGLTSEKIRALMIDPDGTLWIGTEGGGLNRIASGRIESLQTKNGLPNDIVRSIYRDREGTVWLGTNGGGLIGLKLKKFTLYTTRRGMSSDAVRVILEARDGAIWIGTDGGGVNVVRNGAIEVIGRAQGLPSEFARSLLETRDGTIWIGTVGGGLAWHRDGVTKRLDVPLPSDTILSLAEAPDGTLWVGSNRGLTEVRDGRVVRTIDHATGLGDNNVNALQVDARGRVWAGTASGLYIIDGESIETVPLDGPLHSSIFCIRLESDGSAWIGSNGGLALLHDGKVFPFLGKHGAPEDAVFQVLEDRVGFLWMSGNRGITKISRAALEKVAHDGEGRAEAVRYGRADGMRTNQVNGASQPAGWVARDGTLWFPTPWGAVAADLQRMATNPLAPPVVIERVRVDGAPAPIKNGRLVLAAGQHRIEVDYAAMSFIAPEGVRFRTRLEGLDAQWVDAGVRRTEIYTNIGPGAYRFRVIAANNDGVWNEEGATFDLRVESYVWQQPLFIALAAVGVLLLLWGILRLRVRQLVEHRQELQLQVEQRTAELEAANQRLQHLSATDALTGVANRRRFDEALDAEWKRAFRHGEQLSILMVDVDHFKDYNDDFGHQQGDDCLKQIADAIAASPRRAGDIVARYGGDEFAVILPSTGREDAVAIAEATRVAMEGLDIRCRSGLRLTLSIGVATAKPSAGDASKDELVAAADGAVYRAKKEGRNRTGSVELDESGAFVD
ncbi:MAG: two-component regulator propeller domain-containing protein [Thermoanaerobaculia bacterium]